MNRLVTIGASHYCEKARWALQRAGLLFREEFHPPVVHVFVAQRLGGGRTVPLLVTPDAIYPDSTDILKHVDQESPAELRLYPDDPAQRQQVDEWEDRFDEDLGPAVRRLVYWHLLDRPVIYPVLVEGVRGLERVLFRLLFPVARTMIRSALKINADGAERSRFKLESVFEQVGARLKDGRPYLTGDRFTAADLTFAALAVPLLFPPEYEIPMPSLESLPAEFRELVALCRAAPAGEFGLRVYSEHRSDSAGRAYQPTASSTG